MHRTFFRRLKALTATAACAAIVAAPIYGAHAFDVDKDVGVVAPFGKVFGNEHRIQVRRYLHGRDDCPRGLFNKDGFCTPQEVERMWLIGKPLAATIHVVPVPSALAAQLPSTESGYEYGFVNGDIVLFRTEDRLVVDAVVWSS